MAIPELDVNVTHPVAGTFRNNSNATATTHLSSSPETSPRRNRVQYRAFPSFIPPSPSPTLLDDHSSLPEPVASSSLKRKSTREDGTVSRQTVISQAPPLSPHSLTPLTAGRPKRDTSFTTATVTSAIQASPTNCWKPQWLGRWVLGGFTALFAILAVVGAIVAVLAEGEVDMSAEGAWTFVPVILVSILAALWSRVEFQACNYIPWIILDLDNRRRTQTLDTRSRQAARTIMLDYSSMGYPRALYVSLVNRHFFTFGSLVVSILLRVQIVLSTGLFGVDGGIDAPHELFVHQGNIFTMIVLFGICAILTLGLVIFTTPGSGVTPRDPTSLGGTAALLANSSQALSKLSGTGILGIDDVRTKVRGPWCTTLLHHPHIHPSYEFRLELFESEMTHPQEKRTDLPEELPDPYRPWTLRAVTSFGTILVSILLLVGLWLTYVTHEEQDSFKPSDEAYFAWTSLVTLIFLAMASFVACIDFDSRRLTPFMKLVTKECSFEESLGLAYTNELSGITVFKSLKYRDWSVFVTTCTAFLGWVLPIFTAGLFASSHVEVMASAELQEQTYFRADVDSVNMRADNGLVHNILINATPSYPPWTYEALAFPSLVLRANEEEWSAADRRVSATVPATRVTLNCDMEPEVTGDGVDDLRCRPFGADDDEDVCGDDSLVGIVASSCRGYANETSFNFVWGSCEARRVNVYRCNEYFVTVDAETTLEEDDLSFSQYNFPIADDLSEDYAEVELPSEGAYELLRDMSSDDEEMSGLDTFFTTLVRSRLDVTLERLASTDRLNSVVEGITMQHSIIRAQALSGDDVRTSYSAETRPAPAPLEATLVLRRRSVVQASTQTYVLTVLLALIIALTGVWLLIRPKAALPKNPGSIAARASLLADSTIWWHMPKGVEWLSDEKLAYRLRKKKFKMAWFGPSLGRNGVPERTYSVGIVQDNGRALRPPWDVSETNLSRRRQTKGNFDTYY